MVERHSCPIDEMIDRMKRDTDEWIKNYRANEHRERMEKIEKDKLRELEEINRKLGN